ncbi:ribonuclease P protein component [bacterium]|nr:ribonuclease P protein component [bacterium]PIV80991.1 MAG: ribonuclease P protein component [bacterium CG17_big_fil_post_rev_8_21_14_2_50_64_8]PJA75835.1 MAG: ribonuclease P protein component [bacterium CG_4_9_14_3_um_filter_65_15]
MKQRSLAKKSEFKTVYERGVKRIGRLLVVYLLDGSDEARAVVASRKVGGAVQRNRAKRLLREAVRNGVLGRAGGPEAVRTRFFPDSAANTIAGEQPGGLWVVLVARGAILTAGAEDVRRELDHLLEIPETNLRPA